MKNLNYLLIVFGLTTINLELETKNCHAQPGSLDTTFSADGIQTTPIGSGHADYCYQPTLDKS